MTDDEITTDPRNKPGPLSPAWASAMGDADLWAELSLGGNLRPSDLAAANFLNPKGLRYKAFLDRKRPAPQRTGFTVDNLNAALFPHARAATRWALRKGRAAIFAGCGLHKTGIQGCWADEVSRKEGRPVLIFAPLVVAEQSIRDLARDYGLTVSFCESSADIKPGINITNYEKLDRFDSADFCGVALDECFPPDTLIDTPSGACYIKDIHKGDVIVNASGNDEVADVHRRPIESAIRITVSSQRITSSPNHPYFTQRGWVCAQDLQPGDAVMETTAAMRLLRDGGRSKDIPGSNQAFLRQVLFSEMAYEPTIHTCAGPHEGSSRTNRTQEECLVYGPVRRSHSGTESDSQSEAHGRSSRTSKGIARIEEHEAQTFRAWRKREGHDGSSDVPGGSTWGGMDTRVCLVVGSTDSRLSHALQSRLRESRAKNRHRSGWSLALLKEAPGSKEGCEAGFSRLEGLEVLESGHPDLERYRDADGRIYFYDIGATRHPSFSINGLLVHNSSILKSFTGKFRQQITAWAKGLSYRLCCTATPSPNDHVELGTHAEFLGVMRREEMLATFFVHDGGKTSDWRLKGHAEGAFWKWVSTWALAFRKPSDIGFSDEGFELPPLNIVPLTVESPTLDGYIFPVEAKGIKEQREAKRKSIPARMREIAELVNGNEDQWLIFNQLNEESESVAHACPNVAEITGTDTTEKKRSTLLAFLDGSQRGVSSKARIIGFGINAQCCHNMILSIDHSAEAFYQIVRRCWRFGQQRPVTVYALFSEAERGVWNNLQRKLSQADDMAEAMIRHMEEEMKLELAQVAESVATAEIEITRGDRYVMGLGDNVPHMWAVPDESIDYSIYSPPFSSLYTYTALEQDMGNCRTTEQFFEHMGFLAPEMFRTLKSGRLMSFHCMNLPTSKERDGYIGVKDFRGDLIRIFEKVGFIFHSEVCIWKDPVTAMQRTKALGLLHKQIKKDSAMSRQGIADYLITMRKPGKNEDAIAGTLDYYIGGEGSEPPPRGEECPLCSGSKTITSREPEDFGATYPCSCSGRSEADRFSIEVWQRYASPVWMDIDPGDTLQFRSAREHKDERHICPLQLQVIARGIQLWSNPDDLVFSPFAGIGSEGYEALRLGRRFLGFELKESYYRQAIKNLENVQKMPTLQDSLLADAGSQRY